MVTMGVCRFVVWCGVMVRGTTLGLSPSLSLFVNVRQIVGREGKGRWVQLFIVLHDMQICGIKMIVSCIDASQQRMQAMQAMQAMQW